MKSYLYPGGATIIVGGTSPSFVNTPLLPPICDISISYFMLLNLVPVSCSKSNPTYLQDVVPSHCSRFDCKLLEKRLRSIKIVSFERPPNGSKISSSLSAIKAQFEGSSKFAPIGQLDVIYIDHRQKLRHFWFHHVFCTG